MGESFSEAASSDDAKLISAIASGDAAAYAQLHERHVAAARKLAGLVAVPGQAEEVLSAAFAGLQAALRDGGGPAAALRPYLLTEVLRAAGQDPDGAANPGSAANLEADLTGSLLARAFVALPERQRATLWHAVVEQADPAQTARILGDTPDGVAELAATASAAYIQAYLKLYESGHDRQDCKDVVRGLDHGADGALSGLDEFAALPHLRACRECRAAAIELADLGRSLRGWVAPVYLSVAATPGYLAWARVKVTKKAAPAGLAAVGRRRTGETPRRTREKPRRTGERSRRTGEGTRRTGERSRRTSHTPQPTAPPPRPAGPVSHPAEHAPRPPGRPGQGRGLWRRVSRQQRFLAAGGLVLAAFAAAGLALTLASSNARAPQPPQRPAAGAIAPPSPAATAPSSAPAHRRSRPAPSSSPSPRPPKASPTPSPASSTPPSGPVQDPFPPPDHHHHHHPPL